MGWVRCDVLGVGFDAVTMGEALERTLSFLADVRAHYVVTPNAEIVSLCAKRDDVRAAVNMADFVLPDGIGVIRASKTLDRPLPERVSGIDYASALLPLLAERGTRLYLLGAKPGVAEEAARRLTDKYPALVVCGMRDGYFSDGEDVPSAIREAGADAVFVCLGAPRQELWMCEHIADTGAKLLVGLGGTLDVWAGRVKRAPRLFIGLGLEWLYRLLRQPSRLKRVMKLPGFLWAVRRQRARERHSNI